MADREGLAEQKALHSVATFVGEEAH